MIYNKFFCLWWFGFWFYFADRWFYFSVNYKYKPLFSERNGYVWFRKLGPFVFKYENKIKGGKE